MKSAWYLDCEKNIIVRLVTDLVVKIISIVLSYFLTVFSFIVVIKNDSVKHCT